MPMSIDFKRRLSPILTEVCDFFGTPFHIYDEKGIRATGARLETAFSRINYFQEFFAVKALPNPRILEIMNDMGFGFDCSSNTELILTRKVGATPDKIIFSSNNTSCDDFRVAFQEGGCILNLDDISLLSKLPQVPELICFRYNPGERRSGNAIIGNPVESKYGISHAQVIAAYQRARDMGAERFGLHTMLASNELNHVYMVQTARMLLELSEWIQDELGICLEFINIGGGLGIPYRPQDQELAFEKMADEITLLWTQFNTRKGFTPHLFMESGRFMTGPHGVLVTRAINRKDTYRTYIGVDACMSALMRPGIYGAYHHISVAGKSRQTKAQVVDVVGALCENNDKFAIQRRLPLIEDGDLLIIHDTGAHGHAMGFNYNGRLRPKELLLRRDGDVELIRREETPDDYFATLDFEPRRMGTRGN